MKLKFPYGLDPEILGGGGFYWPGSPAKRKEWLSVKRNHPMAAESVYQCRPGRREGAIFLESDLSFFYNAPKYLERGFADPETLAFLSRFQSIIAAWDTGFEATHESDHTVGIVGGLLPCDQYHRGEDPLLYGPCEPHLDVYLLWLTRKKLQWGDLVNEFRTVHQIWRPARHVVEKKGSGISLYQSMTAIDISVEGVASNASKRARAVSGVEAGSTQGWFREGRVRMPIGALWVPDYKKEMKDFTGDDDSADDQVDATVHLCNFAIQMGGSMAMMSSDWVPEQVDQIIHDQERLPEPNASYMPVGAEFLSWIQMAPEFSGDPFIECCHGCMNQKDMNGVSTGYCRVQKRSVASLDMCEHFVDQRAFVA